MERKRDGCRKTDKWIEGIGPINFSLKEFWFGKHWENYLTFYCHKHIIGKPTCPPKLRMTTFTSSPIPSSSLTYEEVMRSYYTLNFTSLRNWLDFYYSYLLAGSVQPPYHQRNIYSITESRHYKYTTVSWQQANNNDAKLIQSRHSFPFELRKVRNILGQYPGRRIKNSQWE